MIMTLDMDVTAERRHYNTHCPLKGKRLTTFCASLRSGGRRLAVRKMIECHISAQPRTPFCHYVAFPLKGKREIWREKQASHILHVLFRCVPLWWLAPPPFPRKRGHYKAPLCCELLMKGLLFRALLSHRSAGGRWCRKAPKGGKPPEVADRRNAYHVI